MDPKVPPADRDMKVAIPADRLRRETGRFYQHDPPSPSFRKTARTNSLPGTLNFPPPKIPPPTINPPGHISIETPLSPTFSTAPTIGSPSQLYRSGRSSPFPPIVGGSGGGSGSVGVQPSPTLGPLPQHQQTVQQSPQQPSTQRKSSISIVNTEPGTDNQLVIHYDPTIKRVSSPHLLLPQDRFHSPDEYDSSDREEEDDDDDGLGASQNGGGGQGGSGALGIQGISSMKRVSSGGIPLNTIERESSTPVNSGGSGIGAGTGRAPITRSTSAGHTSTSPLMTSKTPLSGIPPILNLAPGTRISLQFHTPTNSSTPSPTPQHLPLLPIQTTSPEKSVTSFNTALPPLPTSSSGQNIGMNPLSTPNNSTTSKAPPLPSTPPPPLPPPAFRSLPSSPLSSPHSLLPNSNSHRSSFSSIASTVTESPGSSAPSSPMSGGQPIGNQRSLSFSSTNPASSVGIGTVSSPSKTIGGNLITTSTSTSSSSSTSSSTKPLPPTPLSNIKRSMSLDSQNELIRKAISAAAAGSASSSSTTSSASSSSSSSTPSPTPTGMMVQVTGSNNSPSLSSSPVPSPSPSPRTLDVNLPFSPIPASKSLNNMGSYTAPSNLVSGPAISPLSRFKPRSMSQPYVLSTNSPGVHSLTSPLSADSNESTSFSSILSSSNNSSLSGGGIGASFTPPPSFLSTSSLDHSKFKNRFHSSFDDTPPTISSGGTNLTEIQEVPEEEEREKEKEKLILEKEMTEHSRNSGGTNSRRSSIGAATTRPPSPSSRSTSSPTTSITKEVISRSASSAGSVAYSLSSLHPHALLWGQRETTSFFNRPKEWKCARCKIKYPPLEHSWHCLPDKFFLCNICFNATQVSS